MNTLLWAAQALLAALFLASGLAKLFRSKPSLIERGQTGIEHYSPPFIRFIAVLELLGAVCLVIPWSTGIVPFMTPLVAVCFGALMLAAASAHARLARENRGNTLRHYEEMRNMGNNMLVLVVCALVFVGRGLLHFG
jgi:uncharacterized membrane protein YphA (DoxX/SURF4 family)